MVEGSTSIRSIINAAFIIVKCGICWIQWRINQYSVNENMVENSDRDCLNCVCILCLFQYLYKKNAEHVANFISLFQYKTS